MVAAGGLGDGAAVRGVLDGGAVAAQVGTALLLCDEAGTSAVHRRALRDERFTETVVTRAFSGRYARSLANEFTARYSDAAPPGYPQVNQITAPIRAASLSGRGPAGHQSVGRHRLARHRRRPAAAIVAAWPHWPRGQASRPAGSV